MLFKIDENLPVEACDILRSAGFDSVTVGDQLLSGSPDSNLAAICRDEGRIIMTLDLDFADIRNYPPADYPGIIVLRTQRQDKFTVLAIIQRLVGPLRTEPIDMRLWIVDERRIRIRE